jgi:hypothetical protein
MAAANVNTEAKKSFITKIINAFPDKYVGEQDSKYYFWENGVQIAVSMTCPKTPLGESRNQPSAFAEQAPVQKNIEFTEAERDNLAKVLEALGI